MELLKLLPKHIWNLDGDLNRHQKASFQRDSVQCSADIVTY